MSSEACRSPNPTTRSGFHNHQHDTNATSTPQASIPIAHSSTPADLESNDSTPLKTSQTFSIHYALKLIIDLSRPFITVLQYVQILVLPGLPLYYASRASSVLDLGSQDGTNGEEGVTSNINDSQDDLPEPDRRNIIENNLRPSEAVHLLNITNASSDRQQTIVIFHPSSVPPPSRTPRSALKLEAEWVSYTNMRVAEWKILFTVSCVFVAVSLTIFQIPQATNEPLTRAFTSVAVCRAFSGIVYGPIFPLFFKSRYTRTPKFAILWSKEAGTKGGVSTFWNPWVMISLPAASTLWALIFYFLSILGVTWGAMTNTSQIEHVLAAPLSLATRSVIALSTLVDMACLVGIAFTLRRFRALYSTNPNPRGLSDNHAPSSVDGSIS